MTPTDPASLIVRDGDTAAAAGVIIASPGTPVQFCPILPRFSIRPAPPRSCGGLAVAAAPVDLGQLLNRETNGDTISGTTWLRGTYSGGTLHVAEQAEPDASRPDRAHELPDVLTRTPCLPPEGGWRGQPDTDAINAYVEQHSDRFNGIGINYPEGAVWDPVRIGHDTWVVVVGVSTGDVAQAQAELRARFGGNICAVRVPYTAAEQRQAQHAVNELMKDPHNGIYQSAAGIFAPVPVKVSVLTPERFDQLSEVGLHHLSIDVWLEPVR